MRSRIYAEFVPGGGRLSRTVSAMRTALVNRPTRRVDVVMGVGPLPTEGSIVEGVHRDGRRVVVEWDDGIVLETNVRWAGSWELYRPTEMWSKPMMHARVVIEVADWVAVCFGSAAVETYRMPDRHRHPQSGAIGPDIRRRDIDLPLVTSRVVDPVRADETVVDVLGDPHVVMGVGNVDRSEILWALELGPFVKMSELSYDDAWALVETMRQIATTRDDTLMVYGRVGQPCHRCHASITARKHGDDRRMIYWCPECQRDVAQRLVAPPSFDTVHPAEVLYLNEARVARQRLRIFDDLRELG